MNKATKLALVNLNLNKAPLYALFHSTPVFDSRLRTQWESGWLEFKECFRNLIDGLQRFYGPRPNSKGDHGWAHKKGFHLYEEEYEVEVETIFRSALGCNVGFYSSGYYYYYSNKSYYWYNNYNYYNNYDNNNDDNNNDDNNNNNDYKKNRSSRKKRQWFEDDEDDDKDEDHDKEDKSAREKTDLRKERIALGLSDSGPLSLEDAKNAYRACALKWHPDRHSGSFKAIAEAKFKVCNAAYQSLCDKLGPK